MRRDDQQPKPASETDPRFPSGKWKGFWLQRAFAGRQWMKLAIQFGDGRLTGEGRDCVGPFTLRGTYDLKDGRCAIIKTYPGSHDVFYDGANEGDGKWIWGLWRIRIDSGGFHLWPSGRSDPTGSERSARKQVPVEEPADDLVPV